MLVQTNTDNISQFLVVETDQNIFSLSQFFKFIFFIIYFFRPTIEWLHFLHLSTSEMLAVLKNAIYKSIVARSLCEKEELFSFFFSASGSKQLETLRK